MTEVPWFPHWKYQNVRWLDVVPTSKPRPGNPVAGSPVPLMPHLQAAPGQPAKRRAVLAVTLPPQGPRDIGEV